MRRIQPALFLPILLAVPAIAVPPRAGEVARRISADGVLEPRQVCFEGLRPISRTGSEHERGLLGASAAFLTTNQDPEGDMPRSVAFSGDGTEVVIANRDTDTVSFVDVATRTVTHTLDVGDYPVDVAVAPDNSFAFVPNVFSNTVTVIDVATHTIAATIPITGTQPYIVRVSSDSQTVLVGVINDAVSSAVSVIDVATLTESLSFPTVSQGVFGFFFTPESGIFGEILTQFAISSATNRLVLPDRSQSRVAVYDYTSGAQTLLVTAVGPTSVDVSPDGLLAVVGHEGSTRTVTTIDLSTVAVTHAFATANDLSDQVIRVTHDKSHALIAILNALQFVNLTTGATTATIATGTVGDIKLSFDGQYAFVSNFNARVIHVASQTLVRTITFAACADADASPTEYRAVALNNRFREDAQFYDIQGASGLLEGAVLSGPPEEGDAPRTLAISPDGQTLLVAHNTSDNAAVVDLATQSVRAYVPTGLRSLGCAISADGSTAVVANAGNDTVSILDLSTDTTVATLTVSSGPAEVVISPDGQMAYVTSVAGSDRVHFIQLNGASSTVIGSLLTGQMGVIGYTYGVFSGMAVSPDGATLAICISFDDQIMLVDTATRTEVKRLLVGDFPIRAVFSADSSRIYVTNSFSDNLHVIASSGASSSVIGTVGGIEFPLGVTVGPGDTHSYVGSFDFSNPSMHVIDNASITRIATIPLSSAPRSQTLAGSDLYVTLADGDLVRIEAIGAGSSVAESVALAGSPADLVYSSARHLAVCAEPGALDGVDLVSIGGLGSKYCTANPNSTGSPADLAASGSASSSAASLTLEAAPVPNQNGIFFHGANPNQQPFGNGFLCATGGIARGAVITASGNLASYLYDNSDAKHSLTTHIGSTRHFQFWFRDPMGGGALFNTSNGLSIAILP